MSYDVIVFDDETDFFYGSKEFDSKDEAFAFAHSEKDSNPEMTVRVFGPSDDIILVI